MPAPLPQAVTEDESQPPCKPKVLALAAGPEKARTVAPARTEAAAVARDLMEVMGLKV